MKKQKQIKRRSQMRVNPLTGGTSFGGREGRKARRKQAIKSKKIGDRLLGTRRSEQTQLVTERRK
jgi:hypothetical protein